MAEVESAGLIAGPITDLARSRVEQTYKARDVEGWLDLQFYRPIGFQLARLFARLRFTPSAVSILGGGIGIIAGHFYYYPDVRLNLIGMGLQVVANAFDNADGQLARLTNQGSLHGAMVDGFFDHLVFLSIYLHLVLRYLNEGGSSAIWLLAVAAGGSHALQSMIADYYREGYLYFVAGKSRTGLEAARQDLAAIDRREIVRRLSTRSYINYVRRQETLMPKLRDLRARFADSIPEWLRREYREMCHPLLKWQRLLATNSRMFLLFVFLLLGHPYWFFWSEVTLLNALLILLILRHDGIYQRLLVRTSSEV
jgi:phosphatidylglycerophosphate synthase